MVRIRERTQAGQLSRNRRTCRDDWEFGGVTIPESRRAGRHCWRHTFYSRISSLVFSRPIDTGLSPACRSRQPDCRFSLSTAVEMPALFVDHDVLCRNVERMAGFSRRQGSAVRPPAKTRRTSVIAQVIAQVIAEVIAHLQISAGAIGRCARKIGEAEIPAAAGVAIARPLEPTACHTTVRVDAINDFDESAVRAIKTHARCRPCSECRAGGMTRR